MKTLFRIPPESISDTYSRIKGLLSKNDPIIFEAMKKITAGKRIPFELPSNPSEFEEKHQEITKMLRPSYLAGKEVALRLMEEIYSSVVGTAGAPGVTTEDILNNIFFITNQSATIRLNAEMRWAAEWVVSHPSQSKEKTHVLIDIFDRTWGESVPTYVMHYITSAFFAYEQNMYPAAVALLSIATEATLRDVLEPKGYSFVAGGSSVDVYSYSPATLGVDGTRYTLEFSSPMPKECGDFTTSTGGATTVNVQVRRVLNKRNSRVDLNFIVPPEIIDHLSCATVGTPATKKVNGLGEALNIARNIERVLPPKDLPLDFDEVIKMVRNNLIHLSANTLSAVIPMITDPKSGDPITLGGFLENHDMVYDMMCTIPQFINLQYISLRKAGILAA